MIFLMSVVGQCLVNTVLFNIMLGQDHSSLLMVSSSPLLQGMGHRWKLSKPRKCFYFPFPSVTLITCILVHLKLFLNSMILCSIFSVFFFSPLVSFCVVFIAMSPSLWILSSEIPTLFLFHLMYFSSVVSIPRNLVWVLFDFLSSFLVLE